MSIPTYNENFQYYRELGYSVGEAMFKANQDDLNGINSREAAEKKISDNESIVNSARSQGYQIFDTGNTAYDSQLYDQYMSGTSVQRAVKDIEAAGYNGALAFGNVSGASSGSAAAVSATSTKEELKIAQQNADSARLQAKAAMLNAHANSAKAVSSFLPNKNINLKSYF